MKRRAKPPAIIEIAGRSDAPAPWPHQRGGTEATLKLRRLMLHADMRTGKTRTTIDAIEAAGSRRVLIAGPLIVVDVWATQFAAWAAGAWKLVLLDKRVSSGAKKAALVAQAREAAERGERVAVVVNYESAWRPDLAEELALFDPDALVWDECHKLKSPSGKSSLWAQTMAKSLKRQIVVGLTGTPMPNDPLDLYAQWRAMRPGVLGSSFVQFRARYAELAAREGYQKVVGFKNLDELAARVAPYTHRITKDVLNLLPATHSVVRVDLSPEGRRAYDDLEEQMRCEVADGTITAANGMVALIRLQQITGGNVPTDDGGGAKARIDTAKSDALFDLLESLPANEPAVVIARFVADLDEVHRVARELGRGSLELSGRRRELAAWKAGEAPILAVQIQAGGIGIDLTRASYCCFYSTGFSLGDFEQAQARIHGPDQKRHAHYDYLVARDTVDEAVYGSLSKKRSVAEDIVNGYLRSQRSGVSA